MTAETAIVRAEATAMVMAKARAEAMVVVKVAGGGGDGTGGAGGSGDGNIAAGNLQANDRCSERIEVAFERSKGGEKRGRVFKRGRRRTPERPVRCAG